jgi:hypothetical protein
MSLGLPAPCLYHPPFGMTERSWRRPFAVYQGWFSSLRFFQQAIAGDEDALVE